MSENDKSPADQAARELAIDTQHSILLQAPAGSGKTELLSQRILALLALVEKPEEILAITFTNKAANEMKTRVLEHLHLAQNNLSVDKLTPHQKKSFVLAQAALKNNAARDWDLLNNANRLQIKTIDALNISIVKRMPLLAQTGGLETVEPDMQEIYQEAVAETFTALENDDSNAHALFKVLAHFENNHFILAQLLISMLAKRDQWLRLGIALVDDYDTLRAILERSWYDLVADKVNRLTLKPSFIKKLNFFATYQEQNLSDKEFPPAEYGDDLINDLKLIKLWSALFFTKSNTVRSAKGINKTAGFPIDTSEQKQTKKDFLLFFEATSEDEFLLETILEISFLPEPSFQESQWSLLQSLLQVLRLAVANLQLSFIKNAKVDFTEMGIRAAQALGDLDNPSHLALYMDTKISHILVDEFQDTNHLQFDLLQKLTSHWHSEDKPYTFFAVGDPMQSIYRFREADVGLFLQAKEEGISHIPLMFLELSVNFRSTPKVIQWCNQHFAALFPRYDNALTGAVSYSHSVAHKKSTGLVEFHGFVSPSLEQETHCAIKILSKLTLDNELHEKKKSIGILVRKKSDLLDIAFALKQANIPFYANEMDRLNQLQLVEDIRNLTHSFVHLGNQASWLAVLRAPWCGLTLVDLQRLVDNQEGLLLWESIPQSMHLLSQDGQQRLQSIYALLQTAFTLQTQFPLASVIEKLWVSLGGLSLIEFEHEAIAARMTFQCIEKSVEPWGLDVKLFDTNIVKLFAPSNSDCHLECMTIHKSKGLEFDIVLLPKLGGQGRHASQEILHWAETTDKQLLLAPIKPSRGNEDDLYKYLNQLNNKKEMFESMRLLYVAATRAAEQLHLFATVKPKEKGEIKPAAGSMAALLWKQTKDLFIESTQDSLTPIESPDILLKRFPLSQINQTKGSDRITNQSNPTDLMLKDLNASIIGTVFHLCCEYLTHSSPKQNLLAVFVQTKLMQHNHPDVDQAHTTIMAFINNMVKDETGQWLLNSNHSNSHHEWRLSNKQGDFIIDRCFVADETLWIVDYKTSSLEKNETQEAFVQRMTESYSQQLFAYKKLVLDLSDLPIKMMIYCPAIPTAILLKDS